MKDALFKFMKWIINHFLSFIIHGGGLGIIIGIFLNEIDRKEKNEKIDEENVS